MGSMGVGVPIPSLATTFSTSYTVVKDRVHSVSFQNIGLSRLASQNEIVLPAVDLLDSALFLNSVA